MRSQTAFAKLVAACEMAFERNDIELLRQAVDDLQKHAPAAAKLPIEHRAALAGIFIDAGGMLGNSALVERGRSIFQENWDSLEPKYGPSQLHYNLGNAYKALYDIARAAPDWKCTPAGVELGLEAKASYWRALATAQPDDVSPEQLTNLANALDACGRLIDALHYYDYTLKRFPQFGMALVNRGLGLMYLNQVSGSYSIKLMHEIYRAFRTGASSDSLEPHAREGALRHAEMAARVLREHGHEPEEDPEAVQETEKEAQQHDAYWHWCLDNSLALCEHSLYCRCAGARRDDLSIMTSGAKLSGKKVPAMELLLNRVKSEYCLSRALLFQSTRQDRSLTWDVTQFEGTFTELLDGEDIGLEPEFLRTSFRLCFGILDRIARGICSFLNLATEDEKLIFDSFWRPRGSGSSRWDALNAVSNSSIAALYGLARDLNDRSGGQWSRLKRYRNLFEHELCLVYRDSATPHHGGSPWIHRESIPSISRSELNADALDMLRFTRAAIFYFAFLIRGESRDDSGRKGTPVAFGKKPIGKD